MPGYFLSKARAHLLLSNISSNLLSIGRQETLAETFCFLPDLSNNMGIRVGKSLARHFPARLVLYLKLVKEKNTRCTPRNH